MLARSISWKLAAVVEMAVFEKRVESERSWGVFGRAPVGLWGFVETISMVSSCPSVSPFLPLSEHTRNER